MKISKPSLVVANFKMNLNAKFELNQWHSNFSKARKGLRLKNSTIVLCPPFPLLENFAKKIKSKSIYFGAQNCFWEQKGSFTGEVSPTMLKTMGAKYVILGHSERRRYIGETNQVINFKIKAALKANIQPILCIGETAKEKSGDLTMQVVKKQFKECLSEVPKSKIDQIVFCYEPVWAISSNNPTAPPTTNEIMGARLLLKKLLNQEYGSTTAERTQIIYGGSVSSRNVQEVCVDSGMRGALVGGASLLPHDFVKIAEIFDE